MSWIDGYIGWDGGGWHHMRQVGLSVVTPPTVEPVSIDMHMAQCRVDATDDQSPLFPTQIAGARAWAETYCLRTFPIQTLQMALDRFPGDKGIIELRRPPVQSIVSVTYYDVNDEQQTVDPSTYYCDFDTVAPRLRPTKGNFWPGTSANPITHRMGGIQIRYVAGYTTVPSEVVQAILLVAADLYKNRSSQMELQLYQNMTAQNLLSNYRTF